MKHFYNGFKKIRKRNSKSYPNSDHVLSTIERQHLAIALVIICTPFVIGLSVYLIG